MKLSPETQKKIIDEVIASEGDSIAKKFRPLVLQAIDNLFKADDFRLRIEQEIKDKLINEIEDGDLRDLLNQKQSDALSKRIASAVMGSLGMKD
jgi:hypothetical protein